MAPDLKNAFAERLKEVMAEKNLTQIDLARRLGVTQSAVSLWQKGTLPTRKRAVQIAIHLGLDESWLMTGRGQKELSPEDRRVREEDKAAHAQTLQRLVGEFQQRTKTVIVIDSPDAPERIYDFRGATEEQWRLLSSQIEAANQMVSRSARHSHPA